jgi:hypothetical protein
MTFTVYYSPAPQGRIGGNRNLSSNPANGRFLPRHGDYGTPEYNAWVAMKKRCYSPGNASYENYGARGISVCGKWRTSFRDFLAAVGRRPSPLHSIGRLNNDGNYEPGNVAWQTATEQQLNRRGAHLIEFRGVSKNLSVWASEFGLSHCTIQKRLRSGWPIELALTTPSQKSGCRK